MKKKVDPSEAIDRCCKLMNSVLAGECTDKHWTYSISECTSLQNRKIQFSWNNSSCKGGISLPKDTTIDCSYISPRSGFGGSMIIFSLLGIILSLVYLSLFYKYRNTEPIKKAPLNFSAVVIFGAILNFSSVIFTTGQPNEFKCIFSKWLLVIGFGLSFGGFAVKLKKIYEIYNSHNVSNDYISDIKLYRMLIGLLILDSISLIFWTSINSPTSIISKEEYKVNSRVIPYDVIRCNSFHDQNFITIFFLYVFNILTLIYGLWLSYNTWSIPQSYSETKFVGTSLFIAALAIIIVIPLIWFSYSNEMSYLVKSLILNFATAISLSIFCVPKLRSAYYYSKILYKKKDSEDQLVNPLNSDKITGPLCCPNCGVLINNFNEFKFLE
ncbi:hypothetical protein BCR36DRAFT_281755 [Piromyces finnis]|uniref:G-protein coupled receptors family 3 profile domain-containing protein n=1 Tax=Piromyces finnis TaxID=1754191 RepID=A0A1Y1VGB4_9FUNG|nr:hypothetical protein BCR36DRAFT_281755 [Piromyces finnis]|eukprot:ORX55466.1 hypothetical protein BCR36DRAFT_281755 [Piromyces finnis]